MLEKNRHKRPTLEDILYLPWYAELRTAAQKQINRSSGEGKFKAFSMASSDAAYIEKEIQEIKKM